MQVCLYGDTLHRCAVASRLPGTHIRGISGSGCEQKVYEVCPVLQTVEYLMINVQLRTEKVTLCVCCPVSSSYI